MDPALSTLPPIHGTLFVNIDRVTIVDNDRGRSTKTIVDAQQKQLRYHRGRLVLTIVFENCLFCSSDLFFLSYSTHKFQIQHPSTHSNMLTEAFFETPKRVPNQRIPSGADRPDRHGRHKKTKTMICPCIKHWLIANPNCTSEVTIDIEKETVTTKYTCVVISTVENVENLTSP